MSKSNKSPKITKKPHEFNLGSVFSEKLTDRTLVIFWASWCATCKEDLEELKTFKTSKLPEGFSVLAVNTDEPKDLPQAKFIWSQLGIEGVDLLFDEHAEYQNLLSVDLLPSYFLFEKNGKTLLRLEGQIDLTDKKLLALLFD